MTQSSTLHQDLLDDPRLNQIITLNDGRKLGYAEYGVRDGRPILYFHGGNGSRLEGQWFADTAINNNIRLIVPDRPGFGLSDFQAGRQIKDWVNDVIELTDYLGIDSFSIFGLSGGGPFVAACAYFMPERLTHAAIISGTAPPSATERFKGMWFPVRMIFFFARYFPSLNRLALKQMGKFYSDPEQMRATMLKGLPKPDVEFLERKPIAIDIFSADARESHRHGIDGDAHEWQLYVHDWGFRIEDIEMEIGLWYGKYDAQVTPTMGVYFKDTLQQSLFHLVEDGGHFSTINNHIRNIFDYLVS